MSIFNRTGLSSRELKELANEAHCSKQDVKDRVEIALHGSYTLDEIISKKIYMLNKAQIKALSKRKPIRTYVDILADRDDVSIYDAYTQLRRAKREFGISYANFTSKNLIGADDETLRKVAAKSRRRQEIFAKRIAEIMGISQEEAAARLKDITKKFGYAPNGAYYRQLFLLSDKEISEVKKKDAEERSKIIAKVIKETGWTEGEVKKHISKCNTALGVDPAIYYACKCYKMTPEQLAQCGNMRDSRKISSRYNKKSQDILNNKARFNQTYKNFLGRKFWVNRDTSFEEFEEFVDGLTVLFCKPNNMSFGTGAMKVELEGRDRRELYDWFLDQPKMLVEESLTQHPEMAKYHPSTLNTVRLFTILDEGEFDAFASFVRFGIKGVTDNFSAGGIGCEVDPRTGTVLTDGITKDGTVFERHPVTGIPFKGFQIPLWDKALEKAEAALREVDSVNYVGWDLAIRDDDVVFVEGNAYPDLGVHQAIVMQRGELIKPIYSRYLETEDPKPNEVDESA